MIPEHREESPVQISWNLILKEDDASVLVSDGIDPKINVDDADILDGAATRRCQWVVDGVDRDIVLNRCRREGEQLHAIVFDRLELVVVDFHFHALIVSDPSCLSMPLEKNFVGIMVLTSGGDIGIMCQR